MRNPSDPLLDGKPPRNLTAAIPAAVTAAVIRALEIPVAYCALSCATCASKDDMGLSVLSILCLIPAHELICGWGAAGYHAYEIANKEGCKQGIKAGTCSFFHHAVAVCDHGLVKGTAEYLTDFDYRSSGDQGPDQQTMAI